ncbi:MAG: hypothetical protein M4579_001635 [Chaenotheca gracillima]|nr:MAG: hypothetical protein M4579_001635 [Chaenotheca gracillima]
MTNVWKAAADAVPGREPLRSKGKRVPNNGPTTYQQMAAHQKYQKTGPETAGPSKAGNAVGAPGPSQPLQLIIESQEEPTKLNSRQKRRRLRERLPLFVTHPLSRDVWKGGAQGQDHQGVLGDDPFLGAHNDHPDLNLARKIPESTTSHPSANASYSIAEVASASSSAMDSLGDGEMKGGTNTGESESPNGGHSKREEKKPYLPPHLRGISEAERKLPPHLRIIAESERDLPAHLKTVFISEQKQKTVSGTTEPQFTPDSQSKHPSTSISVPPQQAQLANLTGERVAPNPSTQNNTASPRLNVQSIGLQKARQTGNRTLKATPAPLPARVERIQQRPNDRSNAPLVGHQGHGHGPSTPRPYNPETPSSPAAHFHSAVSQHVAESPAPNVEPQTFTSSRGRLTISTGNTSKLAFAGNMEDEPSKLTSSIETESVHSKTPSVDQQPYELLNWDGNWAPPPIEWEGRDYYEDTRFDVHMNAWRAKCAIRNLFRADLNHPGFGSGESHIGQRCEMVPPPQFPQVKPNPERNPKFSQTSDTSMINMKMKMMGRESRLNMKRMREQTVALETARIMQTFDPYDHENAPKIRVQLRHGRMSDAQACKFIWNWYRKNSVVVPEMEDSSQNLLRAAFEDVNKQSLPWIVAVECTGPGGKNEKVVGFAYAEDYGDPKNAYRYTVELQIFTHHEYLRNGIGKTLMDRALHNLDVGHADREGYIFRGDKQEEWCVGGRRVISKILCNIPYPTNKPTDVAWLKTWFCKEWGFEEMGVMKKVGVKLGKWVDILILQKHTDRKIPDVEKA